VGITYSPNGLVNQVAHSNGVVWSQLADRNGLARPGGFTSALGATTYWSTGSYAYDGAGNVTQVGTSYYLYDNVSRIGTASFSTLPTGGGTATAQSYAYDAFGNLTAFSGANGRNVPIAPQTNRLNSLGTSYDAVGNLTTWNGATYEYDAFNQLRHYLNGTEEWLYMYDADDERVWSFKVGASPRFDRWTLRGQDAQVRRDYEVSGFGWTNWTSGNTWEDFVYRGGSILAGYYSSGQQKHYDLDHLGSPRLVTNFGSAQVAYHVYYPYGEEATAFNQDGERLKFTGHERDLASAAGAGDDLDYMHARHESPIAGRFLSVDRHLGRSSTPQSWNRYSYVQNNPLKLVDLNGEDAIAAFLLGEDYRDVSTFNAVFSMDTIYDVAQGAKTFFTEHRAMFRGLSPVPTTGGELAAVLILPELKLGKALGRFTEITSTMERFTAGQLARFERQLAEESTVTLLKARATFQERILEHLEKIATADKTGGFTSSMEREVRNFQQQVNAIDEVLKRGGYTFIEGQLVRIVPSQ
jgi:RHS repeat-associated protein